MKKIDPCLQCANHFYPKDLPVKKKHFCIYKGKECSEAMEGCFNYQNIKYSMIHFNYENEVVK